MLSKRSDGFHEIETAMLEIAHSDELEILQAVDFSFTSSGIEIPGTGNICTDAFRLLQEDFDIPNVAIRLQKNVPIGGGLGGGSADGAQTLLTVKNLYNLAITDSELEAYAEKLGSDCPFFIRGGLQLATGKGEKLIPLVLDLSHYHIVLVNLGIHVSTQLAYSSVKPNTDRTSITEILKLPIENWNGNLINDFENPVFEQFNSLAVIKQDLYTAGALYAAMTGSGSTLFGVFSEKPAQIKWSYSPVFEVWTKAVQDHSKTPISLLK